MTDESLPRRFGPYLLTAFLQEDALGLVYRALRVTGEKGFARLRILEGPEISEDAVLDAIEENGEIHTFLKNAAISRGVILDSAEGIPYLAWSEDSGRTLDAVMEKARRERQTIPYEHALLIVEKVATALDHAYNTTIEGERTLHGLVWPGFVSLSDDGEIRLTGFGLAGGFLPSVGRPRFAREIAPYLAPEERAQGRIEKNSDVYSLGALLFEMLVGKAPSPSDPAGDLRSALRDGAPIAPEVSAVLRLCLGPPEARFQSSGELRRELGKLLFSGLYSPSTFNLAYFLNGLFSAEMEAEGKARAAESAPDLPEGSAAPAPPRPKPTPPPVSPRPTPASPAPAKSAFPSSRPPAGARSRPGPGRRPFVLGGALLVGAAVAGTMFIVLRRPQPAVRVATIPLLPTERPATPTALPVTASGPTARMTDAEFKDEVARRVSQELRKIDQEMRKRTPPDVSDAAAALKPRPLPPVVTVPARPEPPASAVAVEPPRPSPVRVAIAPAPEPSPSPESESPAPPPPAPAPAAAAPVVEVAPKISRVIKPVYPQLALRAHIGGIVLLRVLVSETGEPVEVQVLKGVAGGLTESAVAAVRAWRFEPATRGGFPVRGWTTIPIPFEP